MVFELLWTEQARGSFMRSCGKTTSNESLWAADPSNENCGGGVLDVLGARPHRIVYDENDETESSGEEWVNVRQIIGFFSSSEE